MCNRSAIDRKMCSIVLLPKMEISLHIFGYNSANKLKRIQIAINELCVKILNIESLQSFYGMTLS